jgi:hypothetical protein
VLHEWIDVPGAEVAERVEQAPVVKEAEVTIELCLWILMNLFFPKLFIARRLAVGCPEGIDAIGP